MTTVSEALQEIVDTLNGADIPTVVDGGRIIPPGIVVVPGTMTFPYLDASQFDMEFNLFLMARDNAGNADVWDQLQDLLQKVRSVYPVSEAIPINRPSSISSTPVPALLVTLNLTIN